MSAPTTERPTCTKRGFPSYAEAMRRLVEIAFEPTGWRHGMKP